MPTAATAAGAPLAHRPHALLTPASFPGSVPHTHYPLLLRYTHLHTFTRRLLLTCARLSPTAPAQPAFLRLSPHFSLKRTAHSPRRPPALPHTSSVPRQQWSGLPTPVITDTPTEALCAMIHCFSGRCPWSAVRHTVTICLGNPQCISYRKLMA